MTAAERHARKIFRDTDAALSDLDATLAANAVDRDQAAATLAKHAAKPTARPWWVFRQYNHLADLFVCAHRWEWAADLCAYRRTRRYPNEVGVHFTVRREQNR